MLRQLLIASNERLDVPRNCYVEKKKLEPVQRLLRILEIHRRESVGSGDAQDVLNDS